MFLSPFHPTAVSPYVLVSGKSRKLYPCCIETELFKSEGSDCHVPTSTPASRNFFDGPRGWRTTLVTLFVTFGASLLNPFCTSFLLRRLSCRLLLTLLSITHCTKDPLSLRVRSILSCPAYLDSGRRCCRVQQRERVPPSHPVGGQP